MEKSDAADSDASLACDKSTDDKKHNMKLENLGPIIINTDGTLGRIPNWAEMPVDEQAKAMRLVSARNKKRLCALAADKAAGNMLDNLTVGNNTAADGVDSMTGRGSGSTTNTVTLSIEHS